MSATNANHREKAKSLGSIGIAVVDGVLSYGLWSLADYFGVHNCPLLREVFYFCHFATLVGVIFILVFPAWPKPKVLLGIWLVLDLGIGFLMFPSIGTPIPGLIVRYAGVYLHPIWYVATAFVAGFLVRAIVFRPKNRGFFGSAQAIVFGRHFPNISPILAAESPPRGPLSTSTRSVVRMGGPVLIPASEAATQNAPPQIISQPATPPTGTSAAISAQGRYSRYSIEVERQRINYLAAYPGKDTWWMLYGCTPQCISNHPEAVIHPVHVAMRIAFTNTTNRTRKIAKYSVESLCQSGTWEPMPTLLPDGGLLYYVPGELAGAMRIELLEPIFDAVIANNSLESEECVRAWILLSKTAKGFTTNFRMRIVDSQGLESVEPIKLSQDTGEPTEPTTKVICFDNLAGFPIRDIC